MLVLTRKCRQSVVVEGCGSAAEMLTVTVLEIRGARVKLGFDVRGDVPVHRGEVWARLNGNGAGDGTTSSLHRAQQSSIPFVSYKESCHELGSDRGQLEADDG
jgi:carbon storage regulator CsrA